MNYISLLSQSLEQLFKHLLNFFKLSNVAANEVSSQGLIDLQFLGLVRVKTVKAAGRVVAQGDSNLRFVELAGVELEDFVKLHGQVLG